jgi:hypothetical protein
MKMVNTLSMKLSRLSLLTQWSMHENLAGLNIFGTIMRKQEKTSEWFKDYLKDLIESVKMTE